VYDAIATEERSKPTVTLVNQGFVNDAISAASGRQMPVARFVVPAIPPECSVIEQIEAGASAVMDDIVTALTKPLSTEEESPKPKELEKHSRIIFKGSLEEVNRFFYKRGCGDGLPLIPPTEEAVAEMLTGTDLPADHVVAKIPPRLGKATVEKIAINAVMAGALPTFMPVLIAAVQAAMEPRAMMHWASATTAAPAPFWIINGPIRNDLNINSGQGALSPGDIANAAFGRTMGLIRSNIAGARKGIESMGTFGNPGMNTMVIAENEEESPWEPFHVDQGFNKGDSTISLSLAGNPVGVSVFGSDAEGILRGILSSFTGGRGGGGTLLVQPQHAKSFAADGWTKKDIAEFIYQQAPRVPAYRLGAYWGTSTPSPGAYDEEGRPTLYKGRVRMRDMDSIPLIRDPNGIRAIVAGGAGGLMIGLVSAMGMANWVTKKVELPANWDELVKKYKDIVPTYFKY
jgi:hypothetical protein